MIRLVILDFDGTLADTQTLIINTMQKVIEKLQLPSRSREQCRAMIGLPLRQTFSDMIPMTEEMADRCHDTYQEIFFADNRPGVVELFPHVEQTMRALHAAGIRLAIASSRSRPSLLGFVEQFGMGDIVEMVVSANDVTQHKPHPESIETILHSLDVAADETLMVGDAPYDIIMGVRAGVHTCGVSYGNNTAEELKASGAEWVVDDFSDVLVKVISLR